MNPVIQNLNRLDETVLGGYQVFTENPFTEESEVEVNSLQPHQLVRATMIKTAEPTRKSWYFWRMTYRVTNLRECFSASRFLSARVQFILCIECWVTGRALPRLGGNESRLVESSIQKICVIKYLFAQ